MISFPSPLSGLEAVLFGSIADGLPEFVAGGRLAQMTDGKSVMKRLHRGSRRREG